MASYETMRKIIEQLMINPALSARQLGREVGISHSTAGEYLSRIEQSGRQVSELYALPPGEFKAALQLGSDRFKEPDYGEAVKYMHPARSYGSHGSRSISDAYVNCYLRKFFADYVEDDGGTCRIAEKLPEDCMSETTFKRRVKEYLHDFSYLFEDEKHSTVPTLTAAGPGGMLQIDAAGDVLPWIDPDGRRHEARVIVGVSVFSGMLFIKAVPDLTKASWISALEDFFYQAGGTWSAVKMDNDSGLARKVNLPLKRGRRVWRYIPHAETLALSKYYQFEIVLAGPRCPRHKAMIERNVHTGEDLSMEVRVIDSGAAAAASGLDDLTAQLREAADRHNREVLKHLGKSRLEVFREEELPALHQPLPPESERFSLRAAVKTAVVNVRGYVRYRGSEYYLGTKYIGCSVLCAESAGLVKFLDFRGNFCYDTYAVPEHESVQIKRFKHRRYFTAAEKYVTRRLPDFLDLCAELPVLHPELSELCSRLWQESVLPDVDITAACNDLLKLCRAYIAWGDRIKPALQMINQRKLTAWSDIKPLLLQAINGKKEDADEQAAAETAVNVRGAAYYYDGEK